MNSKSITLDTATRALAGRVWRDYVRQHRLHLFTAVFFMIATAAALAVQVTLIEPAFDRMMTAGGDFWLWAVPLGFFGAAIVAGATNFAQSVLMQRIGFRVVERVQRQMFDAILSMDLADLHDDGTARQLSRFTLDMQYLRDAVIKAFTGIGRDVLKVLFLGGVMFYANWRLALAAVVFFPLTVLPIVRIGRRLRKVAHNAQTETGQMTSVLDDIFKGARQVKAYNMQGYEKTRAYGAFSAIQRLFLKSAVTRALSYPILDTIGGGTLAVVLFWGGYQVLNGQTTIGGFMTLFAAVLAAYQPMRGLASMNAVLQEGMAAARRVFAMVDYEPSIRDRPDASDLTMSGGGIVFDSVDFSYEKEAAVLSSTSLTIPAGKTIALVGPSGGGKSTVLNLIPRFYDVTGGAIEIDGQDIGGVKLVSLRDAIGLVTQDTSLFNDTIRANIAYGRPSASQADIERAAAAAAAHDFIVGLPNGYDTIAGENGVKLSGGQRQRISIARAMLKNAPILLLDEATSALDTESERQVQAALDRLMKGRTTVVIAHRLSTVRNADIIYVLDRGRVVETGRHNELAARGGLYARLCRLQFQDDAPGDAAAE